MNKTYVKVLSGCLNRDKNKLITIQRNRGVLNSDNSLNEDLIRKCARESLNSIMDFSRDKQIPIEQVIRMHMGNDEKMIFNLIFFYCAFFSKELPDLLLPLAINNFALRIYFNEWLENIKQFNS